MANENATPDYTADRVLNAPDAAAFLSISLVQLRRMTRAGNIRSVRLGERRLGYRLGTLSAFVREREEA